MKRTRRHVRLSVALSLLMALGYLGCPLLDVGEYSQVAAKEAYDAAFEPVDYGKVPLNEISSGSKECKVTNSGSEAFFLVVNSVSGPVELVDEEMPEGEQLLNPDQSAWIPLRLRYNHEALKKPGTYTGSIKISLCVSLLNEETHALYAGGVKKTMTIPVSITTLGIPIKEADIKISNKVYTGKKLTPAPVVSFEGEKLKKGTDYSVSYSKNKNVGSATVTIKGKGRYSGSVKKSFKINPKGSALVKLSPASKKMSVKWKKQSARMPSARIGGYQIRYATDSKFKKNCKTVKVKGYGKTSKTIKKLKSKKTYYVQVRTYMKVGKTSFYSPWSKKKSVKVK